MLKIFFGVDKGVVSSSGRVTKVPALNCFFLGLPSMLANGEALFMGVVLPPFILFNVKCEAEDGQ